ncbi:MAG: TetR/AcrR family transcriptional regulator [Bacteroidetes bacterium]|nr:TetR/AcrR family transcriptional regulator [Bacteroidota bacterium]
MESDQTIRDQIIGKAQELFFARGFCSVTTDEIASELGISKKTLYLHFESKDDMLAVCMRQMKDELEGELKRLVEAREMPFVVKLRTIMTTIGMRISRIGRSHFEDMQRKAPHIVREMEEFRRDRILPLFEQLFAQGARRGKLRRDVDPQLFVMMFYGLVQHMMTPETLALVPHTPPDVFRSILRVMLEGMLTEEAKSELIGGGDETRPASKLFALPGGSGGPPGQSRPRRR